MSVWFRRAHDIAFTIVQALHSPEAEARPQFLRAGGAY